MANTTSRIGIARDNLALMLKNRPALDKVSVDVGYPTGGLKGEQIWIAGRIEDWTQDWVTTAVLEAPLREQFTLLVRVIVTVSGADFSKVQDRLMVIVGEVERTVREDFTLNGAVTVVTNITADMDEGMGDRQRSLAAELRIRCDADLAGLE